MLRQQWRLSATSWQLSILFWVATLQKKYNNNDNKYKQEPGWMFYKQRLQSLQKQCGDNIVQVETFCQSFLKGTFDAKATRHIKDPVKQSGGSATLCSAAAFPSSHSPQSAGNCKLFQIPGTFGTKPSGFKEFHLTARQWLKVHQLDKRLASLEEV